MKIFSGENKTAVLITLFFSYSGELAKNSKNSSRVKDKDVLLSRIYRITLKLYLWQNSAV